MYYISNDIDNSFGQLNLTRLDNPSEEFSGLDVIYEGDKESKWKILYNSNSIRPDWAPHNLTRPIYFHKSWAWGRRD